MTRFAPDLGVVVAFGQFLPRRVRECPSRGFLINAHASLLPKYRGAAPIARAILEGETETGISVMRVEKEMDAGAVADVASTPIDPEENAGQLAERLAQIAAQAIADVVDRIAADRIEWVEQDPAGATTAAKLDRAEAKLDWNQPAPQLVRRVRAFAPKPGAFTLWRGEPLRILAARAHAESVDTRPGCVIAQGGSIRIATGSGSLEPSLLQRAGGRPLALPDFLRGHPIEAGTLLGQEGDAANVAS